MAAYDDPAREAEISVFQVKFKSLLKIIAILLIFCLRKPLHYSSNVVFGCYHRSSEVEGNEVAEIAVIRWTSVWDNCYVYILTQLLKSFF